MTTKKKSDGLKVQDRLCRTCIYRPETHFDIKKMENQVREKVRGKPIDFFRGYRICHHSKDACCRGFWNRHKDKFQLGQLAQRFGLVRFVHEDITQR